MEKQSMWTDPMTIILVVFLIILVLVALGILNLGQIFRWFKGG